MSTRKRRSIFEIINEYFENLEERTERFREALIEKPSWELLSIYHTQKRTQ
jgi:hypothetical protein